MSDFDRYWSQALHFLSDNVFLTIGIGIVLLFFLYRKTAGTIKFLGFCFLLVTVLYIMALLTESGSQGVFQKKGMSTKSERELEK